MKWDEFLMQITVQCVKKKSRAYTGSRLMSVSAWGRVSFFARYRRRPKIGKSRSPPGGVRLFGPLDRRFALVVVYWPRVNSVQSVALLFSLYFYFFIFYHIRYYYICSFASPLCHLYTFAQRDDTFITPSSRWSFPYIYTPNMYMCTRRSAIFKGPWKPSAAKGTLIFRNYTTGRDLFSSGHRCREIHRYKRTRRWRRIYKGGRIPEVDTYNITAVLYITLYIYLQ